MQKTLIVLLICAAVYGTSEQNLKTYKETVANGFHELFNNRTINNEFGKAIGKIGLEHILNEDPQDDIITDLLCGGCSIIVESIVDAINSGITKDEIADAVIQLCQTLQIQPDNVCSSLVNLNVDIFYYIITNKENFNGDSTCSVLLQSFDCAVTDPDEWSIDIHEGQTTEKQFGNDQSFKILHISDIHFDPLYKIGSLRACNSPLCCQYDSGNVETSEDAAGHWTDYGKCDSSLHFVEDSLNQIVKTHADIDYVYFTGDIISHRVWGTDVYNNTKDIKTILQSLEDHFKDIPVFPIVGNHEPHPANVWSPHGMAEDISTQWVFDLTAEEWGRWLPEDTKETILQGGFYTVLVKPGFRVVALNSNVGYSFNWWLLFEDSDSFGQLQWLENVLHNAEQNGEAVHILSHIPSGDSTCHTPWSKVFKQIVERYSNTITGIFNGHTHRDELIVYYKSDEPTKAINVAFNGGSLTPYSYKNPGYKILSIDSQNFDVLNFDAWAMNLTEANLSPNQSPTWYKLYTFKDTYGVDSLRPDDLANLALKMAGEADKTLLKQYLRYKVREGPRADEDCDESCLKEVLCQMVTAVYNNNVNCDLVLDQWI